MRFNKLFLVFTLTFISFLIFNTNVKAATGNTMNDPIDIVFGETYTKSWTRNTDHLNHYNRIKILQKGILTMIFTKPFDSDSEYGSLEITLYNEEGEPIWNTESYRSKSNASSDYTYYIGLDKGTYYITVKPGFYVSAGTITTHYNFAFFQTNDTEVEPNETTSQATSLKLNRMYQGYFGCDGGDYCDNDYYKVSLVSGKKYKIYLDNLDSMDTTLVYLYVPDGEEISLKWNLKVDNDGNNYYEYSCKKTGNYFIKYENYHGIQRKYRIGVYGSVSLEGSDISVDYIPVQLYNGKALTPNPVVKYDGNTLTKGLDYMVSYQNNINSGTATVVITGIGNYTGTIYKYFTIKKQDVTYTTHVQSIGWQPYVSDGAMAGTSGKGLRLEGIKIKTTNGISGNIEYTTHVQNIGWQNWVKNDEMSGTSGKGLRLEAIKIRLTGDLEKQYDVYYRVHAQSFGWLGWAKNGESSGTAGYGYRLEGIEIKLVKKGTAFTAYGQALCFHDKKFESPTISYTTHVQSVGWQNYVEDGAMAGTSGRGLRLEGIKIKLPNQPYTGNIEYRTHVQNIGWQSYVKNDEMSGTSGKGLRLEAIQIRLTGEMAKHYDVYYRVHAQHFGWLGWAKNGEESGTAGYGYRLEGIEIKLVQKGKTVSGYGTISAYYKK